MLVDLLQEMQVAPSPLARLSGRQCWWLCKYSQRFFNTFALVILNASPQVDCFYGYSNLGYSLINRQR